MPPERTDLVLSSDIPHSERNVLVFDGLDIEACESQEGQDAKNWGGGGCEERSTDQ